MPAGSEFYRRRPTRAGAAPTLDSSGLDPVIRIESGTYRSKRFGGDKPKPVLRIVSWKPKIGSPLPPPKKLTAGKILNDEIPI
jgi:hypothetical protein